MSSEVRFGNVSSIDYEAGKCEVTYPDSCLLYTSIATHSNMTDLLHLPRRELVDLCNEVADVWREMEH